MPIDDDAIEAAAAEAAPPQDVTLEWRGLTLTVPPVHRWVFGFQLAQRRQDIAGMAVAILGDDQVDELVEAGLTDAGDIDALLTACVEASRAGEA